MHPVSRVARSGLHTSGADEFTREEGSAAYTHTRLINESSAAVTNLSHPIGPACEAGLSIDACKGGEGRFVWRRYTNRLPLPLHFAADSDEQ